MWGKITRCATPLPCQTPAPAPPPVARPPTAPDPRPTPGWLQEPDPPAPLVATPQRPRPAPPAPRPAAPPAPSTTRRIARRRQRADPVTLPGAPLRTPATDARPTPFTAVGGAAGLAGLVMVAFNPVLGLLLIGAMFALAAPQVRALFTAAIHRFVDWTWDDPVLRRRLLGE